MNASVRDCLVPDFEPLVGGLDLPDKDDRHVLAAAIRCGAQTIVTANVKDFPVTALRRLGIEALTPDDFVFDLSSTRREDRLGPSATAGTVRGRGIGRGASPEIDKWGRPLRTGVLLWAGEARHAGLVP
jgi:hypothetical protein